MNPYLATIMQFAFGFAPKGWAPCDGQLLPINQNTALYSLLGTYYGGNGTNNFALPDLRGRVPIGWGQGPGLPFYSMGEQLGTENVYLTLNNIPQHRHLINASSETGDTADPANAYFANTNTKDNDYKNSGAMVAMNTAMMATAGNNAPVSVMQPYLVVNYCIALQGVYPPRN